MWTLSRQNVHLDKTLALFISETRDVSACLTSWHLAQMKPKQKVSSRNRGESNRPAKRERSNAVG